MDKHIEQLRDLNLDIEELKKRKEEIKRKALEHRDAISNAEADTAIAEVKSINEQITELEERKKDLIKNYGGEEKNMNTFIQNNQSHEQREQAIAQFKQTRQMTLSTEEIRSTLIASEGIAKPTVVDGIRQPFPVLVSILDQVKVVDMKGAGAYKVSFLKQHSAATTKNDGVAQDGSDPVFGTVTITPASIGVTSYVSTQLEKVTPINYYDEVRRSASIALRVKLAQDIVAKIKTAADDAIVPNAMYQTLTASSDNGMLAGSGTVKGNINEKTLRNIVMAYGGDANVMGNAWLYLNKKDLIAFGDVRGTNEKKYVYEITPNASNPNIGIIKDGGLAVPYCIVPTLTELAGKAQTSEAIQTMIYGSPLNFELALFGDMTIEVSKDYKFAEGLLTILGQVTYGGNVTVPNGFVVVTIPATA
jgi:HK97 family phage major capsid protein